MLFVCSIINNKLNIYVNLNEMGLMRKAINWYARLAPSHGRSKPPYEHVVQIGDPILRKICEPVPIEQIKSKEVQNVIQKMKNVLERYSSVGMAAPQIGVNIRIFIMKLTPKQIANLPADVTKRKDISAIPLTVFVNPTLKIVDYKKLIHSEGCESIRSFSADVARYNEVQVTGYDSEGEEILKVFRGWAARVAQHEMDHLDGKLYTDVMDRKTLHCTCWDEVNLSKGNIVIPFKPD